MNQIGDALEKIKQRADKPERGIHSNLHWLVNEMRRDFGETAKKGKGSFGFYLGCLKPIGFERAYQWWREVMDSRCSNPGRLFWWKYKEFLKETKT